MGRKSAAIKPGSRAHARANRFPMRFYLIAVCVVLLCQPVCANRTSLTASQRMVKCPCCRKSRQYCYLNNGDQQHTENPKSCNFCSASGEVSQAKSDRYE